MKKQILIFATITTIVLTSCSKEKIETIETGGNEEIATAKSGSGGSSLTPEKGLLGRYEFNGNLKDTTGKLTNGVPTVNRVLYTTDRKGAAGKAIKFNGAYGVNIFGVPLDSNMSVSVWVKYDMLPTDYQRQMVTCPHSFSLSQVENTFQAAHYYYGGGIVLGPLPVNNNWHHLAATFDGNNLKFYIDGVLQAMGSSAADSGPIVPKSDYLLGYGYNAGYKYWMGSMDDLRFYKKILSDSEVQALKNL